MIIPEGHVHDALMFRRILVPKPGVEKTIEVCACGATRKIERTPTSVLWDAWTMPAGTSRARHALIWA